MSNFPPRSETHYKGLIPTGMGSADISTAGGAVGSVRFPKLARSPDDRETVIGTGWHRPGAAPVLAFKEGGYQPISGLDFTRVRSAKESDTIHLISAREPVITRSVDVFPGSVEIRTAIKPTAKSIGIRQLGEVVCLRLHPELGQPDPLSLVTIGGTPFTDIFDVEKARKNKSIIPIVHDFADGTLDLSIPTYNEYAREIIVDASASNSDPDCERYSQGPIRVSWDAGHPYQHDGLYLRFTVGGGEEPFTSVGPEGVLSFATVLKVGDVALRTQ